MGGSAESNNDEYYESKWKSIVNVLKHSNLKVSRIAQAGSRARRQQRPDSDMDVIFAVADDPSRKAFYPKLMKVLKGNFPYDRIFPGGSYHVVHLTFHNGGKFELVLLTEQNFDSEYYDILEYKRKFL